MQATALGHPLNTPVCIFSTPALDKDVVVVEPSMFLKSLHRASGGTMRVSRVRHPRLGRELLKRPCSGRRDESSSPRFCPRPLDAPGMLTRSTMHMRARGNEPPAGGVDGAFLKPLNALISPIVGSSAVGDFFRGCSS